MANRGSGVFVLMFVCGMVFGAICSPLAAQEMATDDVPIEAPLPPKDDFNDSEFPSRPTPSWVRMIDQGDRDPRLKGLRTPAGIKVEIVAEEPTVIDPVALTFDAKGVAHIIEWRQAATAQHGTYKVPFRDGTVGVVNRMFKPTLDEFKRLEDTDGDGVFDKSTLLMGDLEMSSMALMLEGRALFPSVGKVVSRDFDGEPGSTFGQDIIRGLCGFHHHQVSGLALGADGWMYITTGDDDNRGEGADGSRATVLRTGAIFRSTVDGTQLTEFARGFRNPYRNVAFDQYFNMFHVDNDNEDGSKFQGVRLMHVLEGADYGWRLLPGAVCCRPDNARGAVFGELPGKMPAMLKTGRGAPAGLLIYQGTRFPEFFRGLLIYPDVFRKMVRAYAIQRAGSTFEVTQQFTLMESDDALFRPCQAVTGPDGAIYIVDWRTDSGGAGKLWGDNEHGRIYRLSWGGTEEHLAIPLASRETWKRVKDADIDILFELLNGPDFDLRMHAIETIKNMRLRGDAQLRRLEAFAVDESRTIPGRIAAIGGFSGTVLSSYSLPSLLKLLKDPAFEIRRVAAETLGRSTPDDLISVQVLDALRSALKDEHPAVKRSAALALGTLTPRLKSSFQEGTNQRNLSGGALWEALKAADRGDLYLFDGMIRGIERMDAAGIGVFVQHAAGDNADDRELAITGLESLRTRAGADGLTQVINAKPQRLSDSQIARLLATYRHILVEPALSAKPVIDWLKAHPEASAEAQIAGLETIGLMGGDGEALSGLAEKLLKHADADARLTAIGDIGNSGINTAAPVLAAALIDAKRSASERREIITALGKLRQRTLPFNNLKTPPGVEAVLDQLETAIDNPAQGELRADLLVLLSQVNAARAESIAEKLLESDDLIAVAAAINTLGSRPQRARSIGQMFVDGKINRVMLPRVAEVLQRHVEKDKSGQIRTLLSSGFKGGLLVSLEPAEVKRVETLVAMTGNVQNGKRVFLDKQRTQCANCHKLEGFGGQVGPDLSKVWQTHTVAKIMESMLEPSKEIKEGFSTWTVVTKEGQVFTGLKISQTIREIVIRDATGKDIRVFTENIEETLESKKSVMPEGLAAQLSFQEFVDLVAFLKDPQAQATLREIKVSGE